MKEYLNKIKRRNAEEGLTLVEIMVAVSLLAVVTVMVVALINTTMNSASRFGNVSTSQGQVSNAMNLIQRDISAGTKIEKASTDLITIVTKEDGKEVRVTYFGWTPGQSAPAGFTVPSGVNYPAVIQSRQMLKPDGTVATTGTTVIVKGYARDSFPGTDKDKLFNYYSESNTDVPVPTTASGSSTANSTLETINRVEFRIAANVDGRGTPIQLESSAVINSSKANAGVGSEFYSGVPNCPTGFSTETQSNDTSVVVSWNAANGATSYTLYGEDTTTNRTLPNVLITDPTTLSYTYNGLTRGSTVVWQIQANGPGGTTGLCANTSATIKPAEISFANINSLAGLSDTRSGTGAETLSRDTEAGIPNKSRATSGTAVSGVRYTVARNLENQLAWKTTAGASQYRIYLANNLNSPIATVNNTNVSSTRLLSSYGATTSYVITAWNKGGESDYSTPVTLVSPPIAPNVTAVDTDTSTNSTYTYSDVTVTSKDSDAEGFRVYRSEGYAAASENLCNPANWGTPYKNGGLNFVNDKSVSSQKFRDSESRWGTNSCYLVIPYNDAGSGAGATGDVLHNPGKFSITSTATISSTGVIDTRRTVSGAVGSLSLPWCWSDPNGEVARGINCRGGKGHTSSAYYPIGMMGSKSDRTTELAVRWSRSEGAYDGYKATRDRISSSTTKLDQTPTKVITKTGVDYVAGTQGVNYTKEMPGSVYRFTVTGTAMNGKTRARSTEMVSKPDIPHHLQGIYYVRNYNGKKESRIVLSVHTSAQRGLVSSIKVMTQIPGQSVKTDTKAVTKTVETVYGNWQSKAGVNQRSAQTILTRSVTEAVGTTSSRRIDITVASTTIGRHGELTGFECPVGNSPGVCKSSTGKSQITSGYPLWWTGAPARYWSGGVAANGTQKVTNADAVAEPEEPILSEGEGDSEIGGGDGGAVDPTEACYSSPEDSATFAANCTYGQGIPPTPKVTVTQSGTTQTFTWTSWSGVTGYNLNYTVDEQDTVELNKAATDRTLAVTVPIGSTVSLELIAKNKNNDSEAADVTAATAPGIPKSLAATVNAADSSISATWYSSTGADTYYLYYKKSGASADDENVISVSDPLATISNLDAGTYELRVSAEANGIESAKSATLLRTVP